LSWQARGSGRHCRCLLKGRATQPPPDLQLRRNLEGHEKRILPSAELLSGHKRVPTASASVPQALALGRLRSVLDLRQHLRLDPGALVRSSWVGLRLADQRLQSRLQSLAETRAARHIRTISVELRVPNFFGFGPDCVGCRTDHECFSRRGWPRKGTRMASQGSGDRHGSNRAWFCCRSGNKVYRAGRWGGLADDALAEPSSGHPDLTGSRAGQCLQRERPCITSQPSGTEPSVCRVCSPSAHPSWLVAVHP
jgi:hypothetical protein